MTVAELIELLEEWPMNTPVSFGPSGPPREYVDGDPVEIEGVMLPDGLYIGTLSPQQAAALGWPQ